jgi:hypothetical protein
MPSQMTELRRRRWRLAFAAAISLLALIGYARLRFRPGIEVLVQNTGGTPIRSVVLHVTGNSYPLGDLTSDASGEAVVNSTNESSLTIEFTDSDGKKQQLDADLYFEPGYRGTIRVSMRDGVIERIEQQIKFAGGP